MLSHKIESYKITGKFVTVIPAKYKVEYPYLKEVDGLALANVQRNLQTSFRNCFSKKQTGFPKFKSPKHIKKSYTTNNQKVTIAIINNMIKLPKASIVKAKNPKDYTLIVSSIEKFGLEANSIKNYKRNERICRV